MNGRGLSALDGQLSPHFAGIKAWLYWIIPTSQAGQVPAMRRCSWRGTSSTCKNAHVASESGGRSGASAGPRPRRRTGEVAGRKGAACGYSLVFIFLRTGQASKIIFFSLGGQAAFHTASTAQNRPPAQARHLVHAHSKDKTIPLTASHSSLLNTHTHTHQL